MLILETIAKSLGPYRLTELFGLRGVRSRFENRVRAFPICKILAVLIGLATVFVYATPPAFAQGSSPAQVPADPSLETGFKPYGSFNGGDIDSVNLLNGKLNLHIPLLSYPQVGGKLNMSFSIHYHEPILTYFLDGANCNPDRANTCNQSYLIRPSVQVVADDVPEAPNVGIPYVSIGLPDGYSSISLSKGSGYNIAVDGSGALSTEFKTAACGAAGLTESYQVTDSNGTVFTWDPCLTVNIKDTSGNQIQESSAQTSYTDTMHRVIPIPNTSVIQGAVLPTTTDHSHCTGSLPVYAAYLWTVPTLGGGSATYKICMATISASLPNCSTDGSTRCEDDQASYPEIQSIVLPDNTAWTFGYDSSSAPGIGGPNYGDLTKITFPTGGTISYVWENPPVLPCASGAPVANRIIQSRTINANDGQGPHTTSYSYSIGTGTLPTITATVVDALGNKSIHTITAIANTCDWYETQAQYFQGGTTLLKTITTQYHSDVLNSNKAINVVPTIITTKWANGQTSQIQKDYAYDVPLSGQNVANTTYGNITKEREYDFGSNAPGGLLRQTVTNYQYTVSTSYRTANLVRLPANVAVWDSANTQRAYTTYAYDQSPSPACVCGNQTTLSRWINTSGLYDTSTAVYNVNGTVGSTSDPKGNKTTYAYSSTFDSAYPTTITLPATANGVSHIISKNYDLNSGLVTSSTDQNQNTTYFTYDNMWRLSHISYPDGGSATFTPNESAFPFSLVLTRTIDSTKSYVETHVIDGLGRTSQTQITTSPVGPEGTIFTDTAYDPLGRILSVSNPYRQKTDATYGVKSYVYDALSRTCVIVPQDGTVVPTDTCPTTRPTNDVFTSYSGGTTTVTDQSGISRQSVSDGANRVTKIFEDPSGLNYETDYQYDVLNNPTSVTQKGGSSSASWRNRSFVFNSLSQLISATNPESGTITYGYDADGNLITKRDARGITTTQTYDALSRITQKSYSNGTLTANFLYDVAASWGGPFTNIVGRMTEAYLTDPGLTVGSVFGYDRMGRVAMNNQCAPSTCPTTTGFVQNYSYDLAGDMTSSMASASDITFSYAYDNVGRVTTLTSNFVDANHPATLATVNSHFPAGQVQQITYGNGLTGSNMLNSRLQPCRYNLNFSATLLQACSDAVPSTGNVQDLSYGFSLGASDNGSVTSEVGVGTQTLARTYVYDHLNRLIAMTGPGGSCTGMSWTYDPWGNRLTEGPTAGTCNNSALTYGANNQISTTGFTYDVSGNLLHDASHSYFYDAENRVTQVDGTAGNCITATACYFYDALGDRVERTAGGVTTDYLYDLSRHAVAEFSSLCAMCRTAAYAYLNGELVAQYSDSTTYFVYQDQLGSDRILTSLQGGVADCNAFYPYGEQDLSICVSSNVTTHKFTGKERDSESGLDNFGTRFNSSAVARFASTDPLQISKQRMADPQQWNMYSYTRNNPLLFVDPSGEYICAGTDAECKALSDALNLIKEAQSKFEKRSKEYKKLGDVLKFYGEAGKDNGVTIEFGDLGKTALAGTSVHKHRITITFNLEMMKQSFTGRNDGSDPATETAGTVAHEGTHGIDDIARGWRRPMSRPEEYATEQNAYEANGDVNRGLNVASADGLWEPDWESIDADMLMQNAINQAAKRATDIYCSQQGACKQ